MFTLPRLGTGLAALAVAACASTAVFSGASAAPGNPGTPSDPKVLLSEGFENQLNDGEVVKLDDADPTKRYVPNNASGGYTADPFWLDASYGNGLVLSSLTSSADLTALGYTSPDSPNKDSLRSIALAIGQLNGSANPARNHAVSAYTDNGTAGPANAVGLRTKNALNLDADGRFLTISANIGAVNCRRAAAPLLNFLLSDGGQETAVNAQPLNGCTGAPSDAAFAQRIQGGNAVLFDGDRVGIVVRNVSGRGDGNDYAFDDIRVLDVTPQLDKKFIKPGGTLRPGDTVDLELTVTNTSELGVKTGWEFTDALSKGLKVAGEATTDCAAGTITAREGSRTVKVTDGSIAQGVESCTITVPVTASKGGTFKNSAANISARGLNAPGETAVKYVEPATAPVAAADTGERPQSSTPAVAAIAAGGVLLGGLGLRRLRRKA